MGRCDNPAAALKKRVTVQNLVRTGDGQGGFVETWVDAATVWASVDPYKGWERFQADQAATPVTHKILMRFHRAVSTASRIRYGARVFGVKEVLDPNLDRRFLAIKAIERAEDAYVPDVGAILLRTGGFLRFRAGGNILLRG